MWLFSALFSLTPRSQYGQTALHVLAEKNLHVRRLRSVDHLAVREENMTWRPPPPVVRRHQESCLMLVKECGANIDARDNVRR